jgi:hypothetical protein
MAWRSPMGAKEALIFDVNDGMSVSEAAEEHGVARSCAYKGVSRYRDQNGIHERMHRTLKDWIRRNERSNLRGQQRSFDAFRTEFNHVRPHQSLGQKPPSTAFRPYRALSSGSHSIEYDTNMDVRRVNANGEIKWKGNPIFLSEVLIGSNVGLLAVGESIWSISFGSVRIGYLDELNKAALEPTSANHPRPMSEPGYGRCRAMESRDETASSHSSWKTPMNPAFPTLPTAPASDPRGRSNRGLSFQQPSSMSPVSVLDVSGTHTSRGEKALEVHFPSRAFSPR